MDKRRSEPASAGGGLSAADCLVSVVIPAFNRRRTIERAIASAAAQSHAALEIIVVDDHSSDGTADFVRSMGCSRPVRVIEQPDNRGAPEARNAGLAAARGAFVAFLDSDDEWRSDKIARQLARLGECGEAYGACYSGSRCLAEDGHLTYAMRPTGEGDLRRALLQYNVIGSTSTMLARRDALLAVGGFTPGLSACQDWDLWLRLAERTRFACVPDPLAVLYVATDGRISTSGKARLRGYWYMYRRHLRQGFRAGLADPGMFLAMMGEILMQLDRPRLARRMLYLSWRTKRRSPKRLANWLLATMRIRPRSYLALALLTQRVEVALRRGAVRQAP
ncbi:MAG: glycosyltransferase family A protein [Dongiaceae bacterium]